MSPPHFTTVEYFPILHHPIPLLFGIALLRRG